MSYTTASHRGPSRCFVFLRVFIQSMFIASSVSSSLLFKLWYGCALMLERSKVFRYKMSRIFFLCEKFAHTNVSPSLPLPSFFSANLAHALPSSEAAVFRKNTPINLFYTIYSAPCRWQLAGNIEEHPTAEQQDITPLTILYNKYLILAVIVFLCFEDIIES